MLDRCVDNFFAETEQVAFMTMNVPPGIDFSNDPLLQGRNFSYLDTQLKRLGGPNFTHLPINAPKCPFHHFQQDGHMAMRNPKGRANYEPNSWGGEAGGPRESPATGFKSFPAEETGRKERIRSETFADHYSQARQFYISQTAVEQAHIVAALVFELSKVETPRIRVRVVSHLRNIDEDLARKVADGLGLAEMPAPADAAMPTRMDIRESAALSILRNPPNTFEGRKLGVLLTDGADAKLVAALRSAVKKAGAQIEFITPRVGGVTADDGSLIEGHHQLGGAPSVLFDAVALVGSDADIGTIVDHPAARDFVADAFAHMKFIGHVPAAKALLDKAGVAGPDAGFVALDKATDATPPAARPRPPHPPWPCRALRAYRLAGSRPTCRRAESGGRPADVGGRRSPRAVVGHRWRACVSPRGSAPPAHPPGPDPGRAGPP